jgi:hypothetical protein
MYQYIFIKWERKSKFCTLSPCRAISGEVKRIKKKSLVIGLLLVMSAIFCFNINPVSAQEGSIDSIEKYMSGTDTILNITVTHQAPGFPAGTSNPLNFIDHLEIEIDGAFPYVMVNTADYQVTHFSVQYNMGEVAGSPTVRVRAVSLQTEYDWYGPVNVPEFSLIQLAPILLVASIAILLIKTKITTKSKNRKAICSIFFFLFPIFNSKFIN